MEEEVHTSNENVTNPTYEAYWPKVLFYMYLQLLMLYGICLVFTQACVTTTFYCIVLIIFGVIGVYAGAHRLWAHRSYKASTSLRIFLMLCQTLAGQGSVYNWVKYHRLHHNHFGTNRDPFNPGNGFLYAHFGCHVQKAPAGQEEWLKTVKMSDVEEDAVVMFQKRYYWIMWITIFAVMPVYIPYAYWNESLLCSIFVAGWVRYGIILHLAWLIYSASVIFSLKKGEKFPSDTNLVFLWYKTYWLQYHYLAPWDYQTSEYGGYGTDWISAVIRIFAALELAADLRTTDCAAVQNSLYVATKTNRSVAECLAESEADTHLSKEHYLSPNKYY